MCCTPLTVADGELERLARDGFAFTHGECMRALLAGYGSLADWQSFAESWDDLHLDTFMADGGRYRRRRHAVYTVARGTAPVREAHQPHWQDRDYNRLNGGVARWFEPVSAAVGNGDSLGTILRSCQHWFGGLRPDVPRWKVEVHQFRIEAAGDRPGQPTPEGMHRDGVDYVLVLMIGRRNIARGTTRIHDLAGHELGSFTLAAPFDAAFVDDSRVMHGVTPVEAHHPTAPAYRDVLVVTFKAVEP